MSEQGPSGPRCTRSNTAQVKRLIAKRESKHENITVRIDELYKLLSEGATRRKLDALLSYLLDVFASLQRVCEELAERTWDRDQEWHTTSERWAEAERYRVEQCTAAVRENIATRDGGPESSSGSLTSTWVREHAPRSISDHPDDGQPTDPDNVLLGATAASSFGDKRVAVTFGCR